MSAQIKITPKDNMVIVQITGHATLQDFYDAIDQISDGTKYLYKRRFFDLRKCLFFLSTDELEALADKSKRLGQEYSKVAILVDSDLSFGLSRVYEVFRADKNVESVVFRDKAEAMAWIMSDFP